MQKVAKSLKSSYFCNTMEQGKIRFDKVWAWLIVIGMLFTWLNWQIPRVIDDYPYSRSFVGVASADEDQDINATINGLNDLLASQNTHYQVINGRALVHTFVQMFCCWFGQIPFDILQGILFIFCIVLMARHTGSKHVLAGIPVMLVYLILFREPACIYHGVACGINYLWVMCLMLAFRWLYMKDGKHLVLMGIMAFAAGFSNEAFAIPFAGAFFIEMLLEWKQQSTAKRVMVILMCLGTLLLLAAPSNFARLSATTQAESASALPLHLQPLVNLRITFICILLLVITFFRKRRSFVRENLFWISAIVLSALMSLAIGGENIRQCIGAEIASAILIVKMGREWFSSPLHKPALTICSCTLCLLLLGINIIQYPMSSRFEEVRLKVEESKESRVIVHTKDISYKPQLEKYRCCELSEFQLEQFRWWYKKESVEVSYE